MRRSEMVKTNGITSNLYNDQLHFKAWWGTRKVMITQGPTFHDIWERDEMFERIANLNKSSIAPGCNAMPAAIDEILREVLTYVIIEFSSTSRGTICDPEYEVLPYNGYRWQKQVALLIRIWGAIQK